MNFFRVYILIYSLVFCLLLKVKHSTARTKYDSDSADLDEFQGIKDLSSPKSSITDDLKDPTTSDKVNGSSPSVVYENDSDEKKQPGASAGSPVLGNIHENLETFLTLSDPSSSSIVNPAPNNEQFPNLAESELSTHDGLNLFTPSDPFPPSETTGNLNDEEYIPNISESGISETVEELFPSNSSPEPANQEFFNGGAESMDVSKPLQEFIFMSSQGINSEKIEDSNNKETSDSNMNDDSGVWNVPSLSDVLHA